MKRIAITVVLFLAVQLGSAENTPLMQALKKLEGTKVYPSGIAKLEIRAGSGPFGSKIGMWLPPLEPINVNKVSEGDSGIDLELQATMAGEPFIVYSTLDLKRFAPSSRSLDEALESIGLYRTIPSYLNKREIAAIQKSDLFAGMSQKAISFEFGMPEKVNQTENEEIWFYSKQKLTIQFDTRSKLITHFQRSLDLSGSSDQQ